MTMEGHISWSRRDLLRAVATGSAIPLAGCNNIRNGSSNTASAGVDDVPSPSPTPGDKQPPVIDDYSAISQEAGTVLLVTISVIDNLELASATIEYGDRTINKQLEGEEASITERLSDIAKTPSSTQRPLRFSVQDAAGNKTETDVYPDTASPSLTVAPQIPKTAGTLILSVDGEDNAGLSGLQIQLNDEPVLSTSLIGNTNISREITVDVGDSPQAKLGWRNQVRVVLFDTMGNSISKEFEQYVRKYDVYEDPRLSLGTVYQPYFGFKDKVAEQCRDERIPTIGRYERPLPYEVFNRHIDQMTGHGINRVMIEFLGNETGKHDKRFLEADLIDDIQIEPFYTAAQNLWKKGYWSTVESYRDDLVRPHMTFMRDHILSKDNVTRLNGRPVIQMWNSVNWAQDYEYNRIVEEWGGYDAFFDEIRSLLSVNGTEPFFVGGTNWWGHGGYPGGRRAELTKHFDATTTWMVGAELHDGFTSQETALEWVEENWRGHRDFTDQHDMDFVPMVFPGFNERTPDAGNCDPRDNSGEGRLVPRSPDFFREMLKLADEYRTNELINNSVYNNWQEGTHIEPGIFEPGPFGEKDYGIAYLDVIADFQRT